MKALQCCAQRGRWPYPRRSNAGAGQGARRGVCWKCGKPVHFQRDCTEVPGGATPGGEAPGGDDATKKDQENDQ